MMETQSAKSDRIKQHLLENVDLESALEKKEIDFDYRKFDLTYEEARNIEQNPLKKLLEMLN
ncbi:hypothetical protein AAA799E16_01759 [Marine Group I thaumarchaeote SCGC AAA799-E16]|uniref:Uncharacterized protein n=1 Tax=Marine Group I thaumarchaeote SCGC AAA799-E16 TaxID=1502292 RepID=A0A081S3T4_9ARCH|nr:hypothetical protein AAA799E16_01759 [Marine Group I thaumarchaeote SCGC AAA799-E16]